MAQARYFTVIMATNNRLFTVLKIALLLLVSTALLHAKSIVLPELKVGTNTFTKVTVLDVTKDRVSILHSGGTMNFPAKNISTDAVAVLKAVMRGEEPSAADLSTLVHSEVAPPPPPPPVETNEPKTVELIR